MSLEDRVGALEKRLRLAEDQLEIIHLIHTYGPLIDSDERKAASELWVEDGIHDTDDRPRIVGHKAFQTVMEGMIPLNKMGCTHFYSTPWIKVRGDMADAVTYTLMVFKDTTKQEDTFNVGRAAVSHWALVRTPQGWRVKHRINHKVDGSAVSRDLMKKVMA